MNNIYNIKYKSEDEDVDVLHKLLDVADSSSKSREELLNRLGFISRKRSITRIQFDKFLILLDGYLNIIVSIAIIYPIVAFIFQIKKLSLLLTFIVITSAYLRWSRNQRSKNVDDALKRKDIANSMILQNKDLLSPYVGNVFSTTEQYVEKNLSNKDLITIDMYVYTEIDNLEFVFEKSRAHLIEDQYVVRAIKIFVARAENKGFYNVAKRLIKSGKYNEKFSGAVLRLLFVGQIMSQHNY